MGGKLLLLNSALDLSFADFKPKYSFFLRLDFNWCSVSYSRCPLSFNLVSSLDERWCSFNHGFRRCRLFSLVNRKVKKQNPLSFSRLSFHNCWPYSSIGSWRVHPWIHQHLSQPSRITPCPSRHSKSDKVHSPIVEYSPLLKMVP